MNDLRIADLGGAVHWKRDEDLEAQAQTEEKKQSRQAKWNKAHRERVRQYNRDYYHRKKAAEKEAQAE